MSPADAANAALARFRALSKEVGIPPNFAAFDISKREDFPTLADNAMNDACGVTNPRRLTRDGIIAPYEATYVAEA
jgi:alcohol dehydrogenase